MSKAPYLPFDTSRCEGAGGIKQCTDCLRRTAPGCEYRQPYIAPPAGLSDSVQCSNCIPPDCGPARHASL